MIPISAIRENIIWPRIYPNLNEQQVKQKYDVITYRIETFNKILKTELAEERYEDAIVTRDKLKFFNEQLELLKKLYDKFGY